MGRREIGNFYKPFFEGPGRGGFTPCNRISESLFDQPDVQSVIVEKFASMALVELFDWASWARFFKSGSDANSAVVRIARAHTGRDMALSCAYNGWDEWRVAKFHNTKGWARTDGVPKVFGELVRDVGYAGIPQLEQLFDQYGDQIACIIAVPAFEDRPLDVQFLRRTRQLTDQHRCLLIFDEAKTGFRLSLHGAGSMSGVEPDISTFAKAVANGYPIAALLGGKIWVKC